MSLSSPGSPEAPVRTGRALRRVPRILIIRRRLVLGATVALGGLGLASGAQAHEGADKDVGAVLDRVTEMPGVSFTVERTPLGSQFVLENPTPTEVTILSSVGDPLFRIGPDGVKGNIRSPEWYTSKTPDGAITIPERAVEKGVPVWLKVSDEPNWGWFDHRLHAATVPVDQKATTAPLTHLGTWSVPFQYGATLGTADGHFEYRPALGSFTPELSDTTPASGITFTALTGNPRPGIAVTNTGPTELVVVGDAGEPYLRITSRGVEANGASPTWITSQNPAAQGSAAGDATVPPQWVQVGASSNYAFTLERGEPDRSLAELYGYTSPTVVRDWQMSLLVDGRPVVLDGTTTFTPAGYQSSNWLLWLSVAGGVLLAAGLVAGIVWLRRRRAAAAAKRPASKPAGKKERTTAPA
ncbi:MAG: hypothetical protein ACT4RN_12865 [Pseudonocardia sp.]